MTYYMFNHNPLLILGFIVLIIWSLIWKGMALWKAARRGEKVWFVVLLIVNTAGLLDILYIYFFSNDNVDATRVNEDNKSN